jgi:hypothetical protein
MAKDSQNIPYAPYSIDVNIPVLANELDISWQDTEDLRASCCPEDFAAVRWNMHPSFKAERFAPKNLFMMLGLRLIGADPVMIHPRRNMSTDPSGLPQESSALVTIATRRHLKTVSDLLREIDYGSAAAQEALRIESVESVTSYDRLSVPSDYKDKIFLVSLYTFPGKSEEQSAQEFRAYALGCNFETHPSFFIKKDGLYYLMIRGEKADLDSIAEYTFVRSVTVPQYIH